MRVACLLASFAVVLPGAAGDEEWRRRRAPQTSTDTTPRLPDIAPGTTVDKEVVVTFVIPRAEMPSLPAQPLDKDLRVLLVLPEFDPQSSANVLVWDSVNNKWSYCLRVNLARPVAAALPRVIKSLFPRTTVATTAPASASEYDLLIGLRLWSTATKKTGTNEARGVAIVGTVDVKDPSGQTITTFQAHGSEDAKRSIYWSDRSKAKAVGVPALRMMLQNVIERMVNDEKLRAYMTELAAARQRPADLETTFAFDDRTALLPNGRLDAGETATLVFKVANREGAGPAFGVKLRIDTASPTISLPAESGVGDIAPGRDKEIRVPVTASLDLDTSIVPLNIEVLEKRGYGGRPVVAQFATARLMRPNLEIVDLRVSDRGPRTFGNGDGRLSNGETVEAIVLVRNSGPGAAAGGSMAVATQAAVEIPSREIVLPPTPANAVAELRFLVTIPLTYTAAELPLRLSLAETRGEEVAHAAKDATWPVELQRPALEVAYRVYDGNSAASRGDRDGIANNGETLELVLTPANRGPLQARDVAIKLSSSQTEIGFSRREFAIGELPPHSEGAEQRVILQLPRTMGRDAPMTALPLVVTIAQKDFASREERIALSFAARRPELAARIISAPALREGTTADVWLEIQNQGSLPAEDVHVELTSDHPNLELLDAVGVPSRRLRIHIGDIAARTAMPKKPVKVHVKRNTGTTEGSLKIACTQSAYPAAAANATLRIVKDAASVISAVPDALPEATLVRTAAAPSIAFRRYDDGDRVAEEAIVVRFEVQSVSGVDTVRLEHNGRPVDLGPPARVADEHLWKYDEQIRLTEGANVFEVIAVTPEGVRGSRTLSLYRERRDGKVWVAVVGVSQYQHAAIQDLEFARDDASAIAAYYRDRFQVPAAQRIELLDEDATLANIKRELGTELVARAVNPQDTVIVYFAGHGTKEADPGSSDADGFSKYILPYDADPSNLFGSALSMEELTRILQRLRPECVALIIDSCFSGAAGGGGRTLFEAGENTRSARLTEEFLFRMASSGKGRVILTASSANELARERADLGHGIFTYYLLQGLDDEADQDGDGRVDVDEIYKFVSQKVVTATRGQQNPMKKAPSMTGTIILGKAAATWRARK